MNEGYIRLNRGTTAMELLKNPECFVLLTLIAMRARRTEDGYNPHNLKVGQAMIGDYKSVGFTSEKVYRNVKIKLEKWGFAAFKGANRGTIATLLNSEVYDINADEKGEQKGGQRADKGRTEGDPGADNGRTEGGQGATNKNGNNDKNDKNGKNDKNEKKQAPRVVSLFPLNTDLEKNTEDPGAETKKTGKAKTKASPHLFKDSDIFDIAIFTEKLQGTNYEGANVEYYHESANNWSQSGNNKKIDWLATVKNWMARDMTAGKFITKDFKNQNVINGKQGINGNDHQKSRNVAPGVTVQGYAASLNERFSGEGQ